jgi:hypothetical protein
MTNFVFKFPTFEDNRRIEVERKYCELITDYRNGICLAPEEMDFMDSANSWLLSSESHTNQALRVWSKTS